jgi:hypothetical protein
MLLKQKKQELPELFDFLQNTSLNELNFERDKDATMR